MRHVLTCVMAFTAAAVAVRAVPADTRSTIAERVATALTLALARGERPPEPRRYTSSADAYEHYIRARYLIASASAGV